MALDMLVGLPLAQAEDICKNSGIEYDILYTKDKKTSGDCAVVIAVRHNADKITMVVGSFLIEV